MKKKVITSAILTIALALSLLLGATYALFTSESKTNIAISSGKVDVQAVVLEETIKTYSLGEEQVDGFELGGTVLFEENTLSIEGIMPGDKVEFTIQVKNLSNVAVLYRTILKAAEDNGLFHGLLVTVDGLVYDGSTSISNWETLNATSVVKEVRVSVELPVDRGNEYQDKSTMIQYTVEAVQGNAVVENPQSDTFYIYTAADLVKFAKELNNANFKEKIVLMNDIDMAGVDYVSPSVSNKVRVIDGNNKVIRNLHTIPVGRSTEPGYGEYAFHSGFIGRFEGGLLELKNITFEKASFTGADSVGVAGYLNPRGASFVLDNVDVVDSYVSGIKWIGGVYGYATNEAGNGTITVKNSDVRNLTLEGFDTSMGGLIGHSNGSHTMNVSLEKNTVSNITLLGENPQKEGKMIGTIHLGLTNINDSFVDEINVFESESFYGRYVKGDSSQVLIDGYELISNGMYKGAEATQISNATGLRTLATQVNNGTSYKDKKIELIRNIDLKELEWTPIGKSGAVFEGTFDGMGKTISNLYISLPNESSIGLFGRVSGATIKNFTIHNAYVDGRLYVAAAVGAAGPTVEEISGIQLTGLIQVRGLSYVGGIFGNGYTSKLVNNAINASVGSYVEVDYYYGGGIVGFIGESNGNAMIQDNTVKNIEIRTSTRGYVYGDKVYTGSFIGGISGIAHYGIHFVGNTLENVIITHNVDSGHILQTGFENTVGFIAGITVTHSTIQIVFKDNVIINSTRDLLDSAENTLNNGIVGIERNAGSQGNVTFENNSIE